MGPAEIDELVMAAQAGDQDALDAALRAVIPRLRVSIAARVPQVDWVEEILQETLLAAIEDLGRYRPEGCFLAWLRGIARNTVLSELRRRKRGATSVGDEVEAVLVGCALARSETEAADEAAAEERERHLDKMRTCIERLAPRARTILERRHGEGISLATLAQQFKQSAGAIAAQLKRLRRSVRECMEATHA